MLPARGIAEEGVRYPRGDLEPVAGAQHGRQWRLTLPQRGLAGPLENAHLAASDDEELVGIVHVRLQRLRRCIGEDAAALALHVNEALDEAVAHPAAPLALAVHKCQLCLRGHHVACTG